jgi:hypothetical protein
MIKTKSPYVMKNLMSLFGLMFNGPFSLIYHQESSNSGYSGNGFKSVLIDIIMTEGIHTYFAFQLATVGHNPVALASVFITAGLTLGSLLYSVVQSIYGRYKMSKIGNTEIIEISSFA